MAIYYDCMHPESFSSPSKLYSLEEVIPVLPRKPSYVAWLAFTRLSLHLTYLHIFILYASSEVREKLVHLRDLW